METKAVSDLQLAAFLMANGYPLIRLEGDKQHRIFVFGGCPADIELSYCQPQNNVNARQLFDADYTIKSLIFGRP
jgi:hypothetical protein